VKADHRVRLEDRGPLLVRLTRDELPARRGEAPVSAQLSMEAKVPALQSLDKVEQMETMGQQAP